MMQHIKSRTCAWLVGAAIALVAGAMFVVTGHAQNKEPIKIGFGMSLTGPLSANGKSSLLAMKIWEDDTNAKGGLLGRPVKLIYFDDQSKPDTVPGIYTKLLDIDKVDLIISGYASGQIGPAIPIAIPKADAEFGRNACEGAHENALASGFKIVYEKTYPPSTTDFSPIVRAIQALNPDLLVICSYPLDSVGMVKAMHEVGFKPKMWGCLLYTSDA